MNVLRVAGRVRRALCVLILLGLMAGCSEQTVVVSYAGYNHTATHINSVIVNGQGGVLNVMAFSGGGEMCCVVLRSHWRPGLTIKVKWEEDGDWLLGADGKEVIRNGKRVYASKPYKERELEIPPYLGGEGQNTGQVHIHFFPNDEVKVLVSVYGPGHSTYPYPYPRASNPG